MTILLNNEDFIIRYDDRSDEIVVSSFLDNHFRSEFVINAKPVIYAHWVHFKYPGMWHGEDGAPQWRCSRCGSEQRCNSDFCPNCGATMDEVVCE